MAKQAFSVLRAQDPAIATALLVEVTPVNWHKFPPVGVPAGGFPPINVPTVTFNGGAYGDESQSTSNATVNYTPRTTAAKAAAAVPAQTFATVVNEPKGWISPQEPYGAAPVSPTDDPTITSLAPNTAVAGPTSKPVWVTITGTKFTINSTVETGGVYTPYYRYVSATRIDMLQDATRSVPGIVVVKVIDHGIKSNGSNFTFT
jgi:hypothetical protein